MVGCQSLIRLPPSSAYCLRTERVADCKEGIKATIHTISRIRLDDKPFNPTVAKVIHMGVAKICRTCS